VAGEIRMVAMKTEPLNIEYRARRLWAFTAAVWLAHYLPPRVGFALARMVACLVWDVAAGSGRWVYRVWGGVDRCGTQTVGTT
jgi:hypothetical protein